MKYLILVLLLICCASHRPIQDSRTLIVVLDEDNEFVEDEQTIEVNESVLLKVLFQNPDEENLHPAMYTSGSGIIRHIKYTRDYPNALVPNFYYYIEVKVDSFSQILFVFEGPRGFGDKKLINFKKKS